MHDTHVDQSELQVVVVFRALPHFLFPCYFTRRGNVTVIFTDPSATKSEGIQWSIDNLTIAERNYLRAAQGQPPVGQPLSDAFMEGSCRDITPELVHRRPKLDRTLIERCRETRHRAQQVRSAARRTRTDALLRRAI